MTQKQMARLVYMAFVVVLAWSFLLVLRDTGWLPGMDWIADAVQNEYR